MPTRSLHSRVGYLPSPRLPVCTLLTPSNHPWIASSEEASLPPLLANLRIINPNPGRVLYFLHSTLVLSFYIDVVLTLSIWCFYFLPMNFSILHLKGEYGARDRSGSHSTCYYVTQCRLMMEIVAQTSPGSNCLHFLDEHRYPVYIEREN